jgi:hypothetical protein
MRDIKTYTELSFASLMALVSNTAKDNGNQDRITNMVLGI